MRSVTFKGALVVGGRERGGLDMFCEEVIRVLGTGTSEMPTSSNLAFPPGVTRIGWMPSSPDFSS